MSGLLTLVQKRQALRTRYRSAVVRRDSFGLGPVCRFFVAMIAQHGAIFVEGMHVTLLPSVMRHKPNPRTWSGIRIKIKIEIKNKLKIRSRIRKEDREQDRSGLAFAPP